MSVSPDPQSNAGGIVTGRCVIIHLVENLLVDCSAGKIAAEPMLM